MNQRIIRTTHANSNLHKSVISVPTFICDAPVTFSFSIQESSDSFSTFTLIINSQGENKILRKIYFDKIIYIIFNVTAFSLTK
jgi:hypothetical protein